MTEAEWLACDDPRQVLSWLTGSDWADTSHEWDCRASDRKLRLFACACCRQVWHQLTDPRSRRAVEIAERFADEGAVWEEMHDARRGLGGPARFACMTTATDAARFMQEGHSECPPPAAQAALLRDLFGNPWREVRLCDSIASEHSFNDCWHCQDRLDWLHVMNNGTVPKLAQAVYDERRFEDLPILADALEDAGCDNADILQHCRGKERCPACLGTKKVNTGSGDHGDEYIPCQVCGRSAQGGSNWVEATGCVPAGPHARGCWVVDLLLGKE
jgi:hypothetical protein